MARLSSSSILFDSVMLESSARLSIQPQAVVEIELDDSSKAILVGEQGVGRTSVGRLDPFLGGSVGE